MKLVSSEQMRDLDRATIQDAGIPGETLMDRAGLGVARVVRKMARLAGCTDLPVALVAGHGNNGGDVFVAARYLRSWGLTVDVWLVGSEAQVTGDARLHYDRIRATGIYVRQVQGSEDWQAAIRNRRPGDGIVVDGVLGTGLQGAARSPASDAIDFINALGERNLVVAVDVPSGLNADTGEAEGAVVTADVTVTMGLPKRGLIESCARDYVGSVDTVDIGIPAELVEAVDHDIEMITRHDLRPVFGRRRRESHKGTYGHVLIIAGAKGYSGAASMAAAAAVRSGVGLVSVLVPDSVAGIVAGNVPEAMVHGAPETPEGTLSPDCLTRAQKNINDCDAVLIGPGLTTHPQTRRVVDRVLGEGKRPLVMDADALNVCRGRTDIFRRLARPIILTPHPGEMARLLGTSIAEVQSDRIGKASELAEQTGVVVVLKGSGTVVCTAGQKPCINMTGNPGMATGGMGDTLSGLVAGLVAQGIPAPDASRAGVWLHGLAGDNVAWGSSPLGMKAGDLIDALPEAFRDLTGR